MPPQPPPRKLEDQFVENVSRYPFYLITTLLGGVWVGIRPFANFARKSPLAGVSVGIGFILLMFFIHFTLRGMAGEPFFPDWILRGF